MEDVSPAAREDFVTSPFGPSAVGRNDAVALDRDALKLLASDTRLDILKALRTRRMTVSELSSSLALGKSTVFEHVNKLVDGGLVVRHDDPHREWVYYELAQKSRRLFNPVSAKIVLMLSSVIGLALAALVGWSLVSTAGGGLTVDAGPSEALAGESTVYVIDVRTSGGDAFADAAVWALDAERYQAFRDGTAPAGSMLDTIDGEIAGRAIVRKALAEGDWHFVAQGADDLASRDGSGVVHVTAAQLHADPSPLLVGADEGRPVRLWLTHAGEVLEDGTLSISGTSARFADGDALPVDEPIVMARMDILWPGDASFMYKPATEGSFFAGVRGTLPVELPEVSVAPEFLVLGQSANVTVTVWHGARGSIPDAPVRVVVDDWPFDQLHRSPDATGRTDARGVALVPVAPREPGQVRVYVGDYLVGRIPIVQLMTVSTTSTSLGLELWAEDLATRSAIVNAVVEQSGETVGLTDIDGHLLVSERGPVVVRADGYAPYGLSEPGYEASVVHWVSGPAPDQDDPAPVTVTEIALADGDVRVPAGGVVHVTARLSNPRDTATLERAVLTVDGSTWSVQDVALAPGDSRTVAFPVLLREPGIHRLSVNDASALEVTVVPSPTVQSADIEPHAVPFPWIGAVLMAGAAAVVSRRR